MSEEQNIEVLANMWRQQPHMARMMFPVGIDYPIEPGDNLLLVAERFGIPWQRVAEGALKKMAEGGDAPADGLAAFSPGRVIRIPPPDQAWENSFQPIAPQTMLDLWTRAPATAALLFPGGLPHTVTGDDSLKGLGERFGVPWEAIAEATMGSAKGGEINKWLERNGGRKLPSGYWSFADGMRVTIPPPPGQPAPGIGQALAALGELTGVALA